MIPSAPTDQISAGVLEHGVVTYSGPPRPAPLIATFYSIVGLTPRGVLPILRPMLRPVLGVNPRALHLILGTVLPDAE